MRLPNPSTSTSTSNTFPDSPLCWAQTGQEGKETHKGLRPPAWLRDQRGQQNACTKERPCGGQVWCEFGQSSDLSAPLGFSSPLRKVGASAQPSLLSTLPCPPPPTRCWLCDRRHSHPGVPATILCLAPAHAHPFSSRQAHSCLRVHHNSPQLVRRQLLRELVGGSNQSLVAHPSALGRAAA